MAKVTNGFKSKSKFHVGEKKGTEEIGEVTKKQGTELHRELHKYENIKVQTTGTTNLFKVNQGDHLLTC